MYKINAGFLSLVLICLFSYSCKTQQTYTTDNFEGKMLTFGTSGGFAGTTSENYFFENGQFMHHTSRPKNTITHKNIDQAIIDQAFSNFYSLGFDKLEINDPGNLNYYIKVKEGSNEKVLLWGGNNEPTPELLMVYFKNLSQIAQKFQNVEK